MGREERRGILGRIEALRDSRVLTYVTGDRKPGQALIGDDALRPIYDHLRTIGHVPKLDLFLYSRGGAVDVPWRIITALRTTADEWNILIPFRANSAATLIALGADQIVMGRQGELGPIDPIMAIQKVLPTPGGQPPTVYQDNVNVEDVMAYVRFVRDRAELSDQDALAASLNKLTDRLDPIALGAAYRTHSHIRDVAQRILLSRKKPPLDQDMKSIIETLAEKVYAHGHAIGLAEAIRIGLPAKAAEPELDKAMWSLLGDYEAELKLRDPLDPNLIALTHESYAEPVTIAVVESTWAVHRFDGQVSVRARRQMPQNLSVAVNLNFQLPDIPGRPPVPPDIQQMLQALLQQIQPGIVQEAQRAVQEALRQQAPTGPVEIKFLGGKWVQSN